MIEWLLEPTWINTTIVTINDRIYVWVDIDDENDNPIDADIDD